MTQYSITVSGAELEVIHLAIGRLVPARKVAERKPAERKAYRPKPPTLTDSHRARLTREWERVVGIAVDNPGMGAWGNHLIGGVAESTNREPDSVKAAWGIV